MLSIYGSFVRPLMEYGSHLWRRSTHTALVDYPPLSTSLLPLNFCGSVASLSSIDTSMLTILLSSITACLSPSHAISRDTTFYSRLLLILILFLQPPLGCGFPTRIHQSLRYRRGTKIGSHDSVKKKKKLQTYTLGGDIQNTSTTWKTLHYPLQRQLGIMCDQSTREGQTHANRGQGVKSICKSSPASSFTYSLEMVHSGIATLRLGFLLLELFKNKLCFFSLVVSFFFFFF